MKQMRNLIVNKGSAMFSKLNTGHFAQVSLLLDSAVYMVKALNNSGNDGYKLIAEKKGQKDEQYRVLIQAFRAPYESGLTAICEGIKKQLDMQHEAILQHLGGNHFDDEQIAKYLNDYDECKVYFKDWERAIQRAGTAFNSITSIVTSPFLALEQTYHARLKIVK